MNDLGTKPNRLMATALSRDQYLSCPPGVDQDYRDLWVRVIGGRPPDFYEGADTDLIDQYLQVTLQLRSVMAALREEGTIVEGPKGPQVNPLVMVQSLLGKQARDCMRMLRLSPLARLQQSQVPKAPTRVSGVTLSNDEEDAPTPRRPRLAGVLSR